VGDLVSLLLALALNDGNFGGRLVEAVGNVVDVVKVNEREDAASGHAHSVDHGT